MIHFSFLGTSGAWALPRPRCTCPQCLSPDPRDSRTRSSILLDRRVLIDCGTDFSIQWARAGHPILSDVLLTHGHHDHILGLRDLCPDYADLSWGRVRVWALSDTLDTVRKVHGDLPLEYCEVIPGRAVRIAGYDIEFLEVEHSPRTPTSGILMDGSVFYAPDICCLPRPTASRIRGIDLLVTDGSSPDRSLPNHWPMNEAVQRADELGIERLVFTHVGHSGQTMGDLQAMLQRPTHHIAWDGLSISSGK
ncbi:MAG TPA: MBL fold metallo-hydrolase [Thermoanaerobaculia bacterium]|nr:MBL fold metallo-hydrolase [Thermoanaerobaculia bacterium]HUM30339.1 MBL fold metallo-hydrolase [Thermoanaerobaculia bacterium]HXK68510.1 MBL fold metallo-hydrolase [Thermoanaerobaculia bacterium]